MEDKLPRFEVPTQPIQSEIRFHDPSDAKDDRCRSLDKELKNLLSNFRSLQADLDEQIGQATPASRSEPIEARSGQNDSHGTMAEISTIQRDLSNLLALHDENDSMREVIAEATDDVVDDESVAMNPTEPQPTRLRIFDPDNQMKESTASPLTQTLSDLQREIEGGEDDLAHAQRMLDRLFVSTSCDEEPSNDSDMSDPALRIASCSVVDGEQQCSETEAVAALEHVISDADSDLIEKVDELVQQEQQLQSQLADAIAQREGLNEQFEKLQIDTANQKELHAAELIASESAAQQMIQEQVAAERLSLAQSQSNSLAEQLQRLQDAQEAQNTELETQRREIQSRLETAICSEAELRVKLDVAHETLEKEQLQSAKTESQYAEKISVLAEQLDETQAAADRLATEQQHLESLKVTLKDERDQSIQENETLRSSLADNEDRLETLKQEVQREREAATEETLSIQENLTADQERLEGIRKELESQRDKALAENTQLRAQIETLHQESAEIQMQVDQQSEQLQASAAGETEIRQTLQQERVAAEKTVNELTTLRDGHNILQEKCADQVAQIESLLQQKDELANEQDSKSKSLNAQTAELMRMSATHQNLVKQSEAQSNQIAALLRENEDHCADRDRSAEVISQKDTQLAELLDLQDRLAKQLGVLTEQVRTLLTRHEETKESETESRQQLAAQLNEIAELEQKYTDERSQSESQTQQLDELRRQRDLLNLQLTENEESLSARQEELDGLMASYELEQQNCLTQTESLQSLKVEHDRLLADESAASVSLCETLRERMKEIERLQESHEAIRAQSVEQADKIMRLINENQRLTRADRLRAQELAERKAELVHLRDALEDLKLNADTQASRIDLLINEKRQLIQEKNEAEALGFANLQAAADDFERLKAEKKAVDERLKELQSSSASSEPSNRMIGLTSNKDEAKRRASLHVDDLTKIEGIGPKIQSLLAEKRIVSYRKLAATTVDRLQKILLDAGGRYHLHDPSTWPDQAQLAAEGDWKKLVRLQDSLVGGRRAG